MMQKNSRQQQEAIKHNKIKGHEESTQTNT